LDLPEFSVSVWFRLANPKFKFGDVFIIFQRGELTHLLVIGSANDLNTVANDASVFETKGTAYAWWQSSTQYRACLPSIPSVKPFVLSRQQQILQFQAIKTGYLKWITSTASKASENHILSGFQAHPECLPFELLQNAVDAGATEVKFQITNQNELIVEHNGRSFDLVDIHSLTNFATSSKQPNSNSIGYKGIGFKSVFAVTDKVTIASHPFSLEYVKTRADRFSYIELGAFEFNSTATPPKNQISPLTSIKIQVSSSTIERLVDRLEEMMDSNALLILASLDKPIRQLSWQHGNSKKVRTSTIGDITWNHNALGKYSQAVVHFEGRRYLVVRRGNFPSDYICLCFWIDTPLFGEIEPGIIYTFLPLMEEKSKLLMDVHAPFVVDALRQRIEPTKERDIYYQQIGVGIANMMEALYMVLHQTDRAHLKHLYWRLVPPHISRSTRKSFEEFFLKSELAFTLPRGILQAVGSQKLLESSDESVAGDHIDISMLPRKQLDSVRMLLQSLNSHIVSAPPELRPWITKFWGTTRSTTPPFEGIQERKLDNVETTDLLRQSNPSEKQLQRGAFGHVLDLAWTKRAKEHLSLLIQQRSFESLRAFLFIATHMPQHRKMLQYYKSDRGSKYSTIDLKTNCSILTFLTQELKDPWIPCGGALYRPNEVMMGMQKQIFDPFEHFKSDEPSTAVSILETMSNVPMVDFELLEEGNPQIIGELGFCRQDSIEAFAMRLKGLKSATIQLKSGSLNERSSTISVGATSSRPHFTKPTKPELTVETLTQAVSMLYLNMFKLSVSSDDKQRLASIFAEEELVLSQSSRTDWQWQSPKDLLWESPTSQLCVKKQYNDELYPFFQLIGVPTSPSSRQLIAHLNPDLGAVEAAKIFDALSRSMEGKTDFSPQEVERFVTSDRFFLWHRNGNVCQPSSKRGPLLAMDGLDLLEMAFSKKTEKFSHFVHPEVSKALSPKLRLLLESKGIMVFLNEQLKEVVLLEKPSLVEPTSVARGLLNRLAMLNAMAEDVLTVPMFPWRVHFMSQRQLPCKFLRGLGEEPVQARAVVHANDIYLSNNGPINLVGPMVWAFACLRPPWLRFDASASEFVHLLELLKVHFGTNEINSAPPRSFSNKLAPALKELARADYIRENSPNNATVPLPSPCPGESPSSSIQPSKTGIDILIDHLKNGEEEDSDWDPSLDGEGDDEFGDFETESAASGDNEEDDSPSNISLATPKRTSTPLKHGIASPKSEEKKPSISPSSSSTSSSSETLNGSVLFASPSASSSASTTPASVARKTPAAVASTPSPLNASGSRSSSSSTLSGSKFRQGRAKTGKEVEEDGLRGAYAEVVALLYEHARLLKHEHYRSIPFLAAGKAMTSEEEMQMLKAHVCSTAGPHPLPFLLNASENLQFSTTAPWDIHSYDYIDGKWTRIRLEVKCSKGHNRSFYLSSKEYDHLESASSPNELPYIVYLYQDFEHTQVDLKKPVEPTFVLRFPKDLNLVAIKPTEYSAKVLDSCITK
jgi:hypothetical protein